MAATNKAAEAAKESTANNATEVAKKSTANALEVIAKVDVFYRAGREWSQVPKTVLLTELSEQDINDLKAEPMLIVREVEIATE